MDTYSGNIKIFSNNNNKIKMPEVQTAPIEVETTKEQKGEVVFFKNISYPTPTKLANITEALRYFALSLITTVAAASGTTADALFSLAQSKWIVFWLTIVIFFLKAIDIGVGVRPPEQNK